MKKATLGISGDDNLKQLLFQVDNVSQQSWIQEKKLREMEGKLQEVLESKKVRLEVGVKPYIEQPKENTCLLRRPRI